MPEDNHYEALPSGMTMVRVLKYKNTGFAAWPETAVIIRASGDRLLKNDFTPIGKSVAAGEVVEIKIEIIAPAGL